MAAVTIVLTMPEAQALYRALCAYADALPDEPAQDGAAPRTRGEKLVDCLLDLVLRPGETDLPPVQVLLTVVASLGTLLGGDQPGEVDGQVVPAEMVRHLLRALDGRGVERDVCEPSGGTEPDAAEGPGPQADDDELAAWWDEVERRVLAGELPDEPDPVPDEVLRRWAEEVPSDLGNGSPPPSVGASATPATDSLPGPAPGPARASAPSPGSGWWALADEAVRAASEALHTATQAFGRARRMVRTARVADAADEEAWQTGPAGRVSAAADAIAALEAATAAQRLELADLLDATAGGGLAARPRIALVDALSGTLVALGDLPALRRSGSCGEPACRRRPQGCAHDLAGSPGVGPPGPTDGYRPGRELDRWVRARDRRCRFPGCRRRVPKGGELDHDRRYPEGPTSATNLAGYCTPNHRGKHQAPGFEHELHPDGALTVRTPSGMTTTTTPEPY
jgi:hypothetical protein